MSASLLRRRLQCGPCAVSATCYVVARLRSRRPRRSARPSQRLPSHTGRQNLQKPKKTTLCDVTEDENLQKMKITVPAPCNALTGQNLPGSERGRGAHEQYGLPILHNMANISTMKTTVDLADALLLRAKRHAKRTGQPLRVLIEEGLRRVLEDESAAAEFRLEDKSVGKPGAKNPLENLSWHELRDEIYGSR